MSIKPLFRGINHAILFLNVLPISYIYLYRNANDLVEYLAIFLFTLSSTILYGTSSLLHLGNWSSKEAYNLMKQIDHTSILFSIYCNTLVVSLLGFRENYLLCLLTTCLASYNFPKNLERLVKYPEDHIQSYNDQSLLLLPFLILMKLNPYLYCSFFFYLLGMLCYLTKKPVLFPRYFGYHEVFHLFTTLSFAFNIKYIMSMIN